MKSRPIITAAVLASTTHAQVLQLDIEKRQPQHLSRRAANTLDVDVQNLETLGGYFVTVQVGTPAQKFALQLDTGSSDIWLPASISAICISNGCPLGSFDQTASHTFETVGKGLFSIQYIDQTFSQGDYFRDVFMIGGASIQNLTMGLGQRTNIQSGLMGVGYSTIESSVQTAGKTYPNLPVALQQDGLIETIAYSLWLNDLDANTGSILFGGIDTEKYVGNLALLNLVPGQQNSKTIQAFAIPLYSLDATSSSGSDSLPTQMKSVVPVLDSGTTLSYLPQDWAEQVWQEVGAVYDPQSQLSLLPCSMQNSNGFFTFGLGGPNGPKINVTMDELVLEVTGGRPPKFTAGPFKGQSICACGIQNQTQAPYLLGDTFLRSSYVVYDLVNDQVAIAATDFNATKSNVVPFPSNGAPIPSATAVASQTNTPALTGPKRDSFAAQAGFLEAAHSAESAAQSLVALTGSSMVVVGLTMIYLLTAS